MSQDGNSIVCRRCGETIPLEGESCPHCGKEIRSISGPIVGVVLGAILVVSAILGGSDLYFFGAVGLVMAGAGGYLLYERRQRIQQARERGGATTVADEDEDGEESLF